MDGELVQTTQDRSAESAHCHRRVAALRRPGVVDRERGALVASGPGIAAVAKRSPAERAGIREDDIITEVNGDEITGNRALADLIAEYAPESAVTLTVVRRNTVREVEVTLEPAP